MIRFLRLSILHALLKNSCYFIVRFSVKFLFVLLFSFSLVSCAIVRNEAEFCNLINNESAKQIVVKNDIDLHGKTVTLPKGCTIRFKQGSISNGAIVFNSTRIRGNAKFAKCTYQGRISIKSIDDRCFTSDDDLGTLRFLLENTIINGVNGNFYRDYHIDMNDVNGGGLVSISDYESGSLISFNGNTIYNTKPFATRRIKPLIVLCNVKGVTIRDCIFHDTIEHNTHNFKNSAGCTFIQCYGDCEAINLLNCIQENGDCILRSGVYTHNVKHPERTPTIGLSNSTIKVKSINAGYGLALYCGDNLDIDVSAISPHRGFYCAGVSNARVNYYGYNPIETKCHVLIKDAVYKTSEDDKDGAVVDMKGCHDMVINVLIDDVPQTECIISFQSYGSGRNDGADFSFRSNICHHYNIDIKETINRTSGSGSFFISGFASSSATSNDKEIYGCKVSNIRIHDVSCNGGEMIPYMCNVGSNIDADVTVENCSTYGNNDNQRIGGGFNYLIRGNSEGRVRIINSQMGNIYERDKTEGEFNVDVSGSSITRDIIPIKDKSSRNLVRVIR